jgi:hypothetical protein
VVSAKGRTLMRTDVGKRPLDQRLLGPGKNLARHRTSLRLTAALAVLLLTTAGAAALSAARPVRAEKLVHGSDQQGCFPAVLP